MFKSRILNNFICRYLTSHLALDILITDMKMPEEFTSKLNDLRNECLPQLISQIAIRLDESQNRQALFAFVHE